MELSSLPLLILPKSNEKKDMCEGSAVPFFDVTIPPHLNVLIVISLFYSFLPYFIALVFLILAIARRLFFILVSLFVCWLVGWLVDWLVV